jgi:uncharacterized protein YkwD
MRHRDLCIRWLAASLLLWSLGGCPTVGPDSGSTGTTDNPGTGTGAATTGTSGATTTGTGTAGSTTTGTFSDCTVPLAADTWQAEVLRLVNAERAKVGLSALTYNAQLQVQAAAYACEMVHYHFFAHVDPVDQSTLANRADEFGYAYWAIGENLAAGQPTPAKVMSDWMNSTGHRENILNPAFTELGIAVRSGGDYGIYWVQEFGRPRSAGPVPGDQ